MTNDLKKKFGLKLKDLRAKLQNDRFPTKSPSIREFAKYAKVNFSLIGALENGRRNAGEKTLEKLAIAFGLDTKETNEFIVEGLNTASKDRMMRSHAEFPTELLHVIPNEMLNEHPPIDASSIMEVIHQRDFPRQVMPDLLLRSSTGDVDRWIAVEIVITSGANKNEATSKLRRKLEKKAELLNPHETT